jgi:Mrp family chromosome partitioning ATPase
MSIAIPSAPGTTRRRKRLGFFGPASAEQPLISNDASSPFAESFRLLALNIQTLLAFDARKALVVMSGYAKDGRSVVAANLALALAEQHNVLLIDERRRGFAGPGSLTDIFRTGTVPADTMIPGEMQRSIVPTKHPRISIMPRLVDAASAEDDVEAAIARASDAGVYTIIDTPPALAASDAFAEAQMAGNALYVVRGATTDLDAHRRVREQLERLNVNILGILVNER